MLIIIGFEAVRINFKTDGSFLQSLLELQFLCLSGFKQTDWYKWDNVFRSSQTATVGLQSWM